MIPSLADSHGLDTTANALTSADKPGPETDTLAKASGRAPDDNEILRMVKEAESLSSTYMQTAHRTSWIRSVRAYRNEHFEGSKYLSEQYKARSKIFRPKTRAAVRKNMASAAEALFSTTDAITISAQDEANDMERASAAIKQQLVNYRLSRKSLRNGIPWFKTSMGARQDAQLMGVCCSVQDWAYEERPTGAKFGADGASVATEVVRDTPTCTLIPPENVLIDPAADWIDPTNTASYVILRWPMHVDAVMGMMTKNPRDMTPWRSVTREEVKSYAVSPIDTQALRRAREGGTDSKDRTTTGNTSAFGIVWVFQVFMRIDGEDQHFWCLDSRRLLSDPVPTRVRFPWRGGERPLAFGIGAMDAHVLFPMAPAESWQQVQQEINDVANLSLDHMKQVVSPITKVKRGRQVDIQQVQKRGPGSVVMLKDMEDVEFDRPQDVPPSAQLQQNLLSSDFDDLSGSFNQGSVQTNRQLNETVGGMKLLSGSANAVTEFDLKLWIETWVEPVLEQLVRLEEFYEDDAKVLAIAGNRARLFERFGVSQVTDQLLLAEVNTIVNAGTGGGIDPMQKLQKLEMAAKVAGEILTPFVEAGTIQPPVPKTHEILTEIFSNAGYKDGGDRFFENPLDQPPQQPQPNPEQMKAQQEMQQAAEAHKNDEARKDQLHQQKLQATASQAARKAQSSSLSEAASEHKALASAHTREMETHAAKEKADLKVQAEESKADSVKKIEEAKQKKAMLDLEIAREEAEIKRLELKAKREDLELEDERRSLERAQIASQRRQIAVDEEAAKVKLQADKAKALAAKKAAAAKPVTPAKPKGKA